MLTSDETVWSSTLVPLALVPARHPQADPACSYAIGPLDPAQMIVLHTQFSTGDACCLLVPVHLPHPILDDPAFRDGYESNYLSEEEEGEWTSRVPRMANHIYSSLTDTRFYRDWDTGEVLADFLPCQVGWLLRDLTRLAETDRTLAYVGMAHLCFLFSLLAQACPGDWPHCLPAHARLLHDDAVKAYRGRMRPYREQGMSYDEAQRLALCEQAGG